MGEVAPLYGVDSALVLLTNPGVQQGNLRHKPSTSCTQDHLCLVNDYTRQEVGPFKRNTAHLEEQTSKNKKSLSVRCKQPCRRNPEASEVEG